MHTDQEGNYFMFGGLFHELTEEIIGAYYHVYNAMGSGFLEKVYENALAIELRKRGYHVVTQQPIRVYYFGEIVGEYFADLIVDRKVIIELKVADKIGKAHIAQLLNYLSGTDAQVGLILLFGKNPDFKRKILTNDKKKHRPSSTNS